MGKFYDNMISELKKLRIYNLTEGSKAESDIFVLADMLETIDTMIDQLLGGCAITSINSLNKRNFCKLFALPESISLTNLKECVANRIGVSNRDFTKKGVIKSLYALGFTATISENFTSNTITVTVTGNKNHFFTKQEKEDAIKSCLPCHTNNVIIWKS